MGMDDSRDDQSRDLSGILSSFRLLDDSQPPLGIVVKQHSLVYEDAGQRITVGRAEPPSRHRLCDRGIRLG